MERVSFALRGTNGGLVSGTKFDNKEKNSGADKHTSYFTVPLVEILEQNNAPAVIDYFSLDVEGAESYIMGDFPFDKYTFKVMTIERPKPDLQEKLKQNGYEFLRKISGFGETLWVHESSKDSLDLSSLERFKSFK